MAIKRVFQKEPVLSIAACLALVSSCFVLPDAEYLGYIDFRTLAILFSLMTVMAGLRGQGVFDRLGRALLSHTRTTLQLTAVLVGLCFFSSMVITNDVSLLTFVPFTFVVVNSLDAAVRDKLLLPIVCMQTIAANLGSMLTPLGNPQNLYLYGKSGMDMGSFVLLMLPYSILSLALLALWAVGLCRRGAKISMAHSAAAASPNKALLSLYSILFVLCLLVVLRVLPYGIAFAAVLACVLLADRNTLCRVDYSLILTFVMLFIGYGITTAAVGIILTCSRILDGITDPLLAFVYDRVNTKFGKLRILLVAGYLIEALALYGMFTGFSSKGLGLPVFALLYIVYIIGYTITNMTAQTIPAIMTNDPRQRPTIGVWTTAFNYLVPMAMSMIFNVVLLPKCGGTYNQAFLSAACNMTLLAAGIGTALVCLGVSAYDKPETFVGTKKSEPLKMSDIIEVLKHNRPLQCYIASNASDKLAQQVASQAIINTLFNGILIGNMGLATILTVISMVPSIFFAAFGAKYVGKHGSKNGIVTWTYVSMTITAVLVLFFIFGDPTQIGVMGSPSMILYVVLTLLQNGSNMCITTSNTSYMADAIDFELDRSGRYIPAVVSGTYSLVDKLITSFAAVIATGAVALLGYTTTMPQPTDPCTSAIFWMTLSLKFGLPLIGWVITLVAMRECPLTKEEMVNVQKRIAEKKAAAQSEFYKKQLQ